MNSIIAFINKMKIVFSLLPDEEIDTYNNIYNESTEEFIVWINKKYEEYMNIVDRISKIPNINIVDKINKISN